MQIISDDLIDAVRPYAIEDILTLASNTAFLGDNDGRENSFVMRGFQGTPVLRDGFRVETFGGVSDPDLLNVSVFPTVTFASETITMQSETEGTMAGNVTMLGAVAPVELQFTLLRDRTYPDFIPNYDEIRTASFQASGTLTRADFGMDFIAFPGSPIGLEIDLDILIDLVDCGSLPEAVRATNVPCNWGYVEGFKGPNES